MSIYSQHHSFDIHLASKYGIECALLIHHFQHWIGVNRRNKRNLHEGRCWTYQTREEISSYFPYWSTETVRYLCQKLVQLKILMTGNFNRTKYDRTLWYAFVDEEKFGVDENSNISYKREKSQMVEGISPQGVEEIPTPIPDSITDSKEQERKATPPPPPSRIKIKEEKKEMAERVLITQSQHENLLKKLGNDPEKLKACYEKLSIWKIGKQIMGGTDYRSILNWVIKAVEEDASKPKPLDYESMNKTLVLKISERYNNHPDISVGYNYIEFNFGALNRPHLKFSDHGFREQVLNNLRKMNLPTQGL